MSGLVGHHGLLLSSSAAVAYLDLLATAPRAALSLRKVISTATNAIRVRRSSDNAEQDIGFVGDVLDTASLATFVGANSAYVKTFYDQTGNGFFATQATAANQARIVNAGTYDGSLILDGTNDSYKITALTLGTPQVGIYAKALIPAAGSSKIFVESNSAFDAVAQSFAVYENAPIYTASSNAPTTNNRTRSFPRPTTLSQMTWLFDRSISGNTEERMWTGGASQTGTDFGITEQTGNYVTGDINIGSRNGASLFMAANIETLVFYNADSSAIRASIETIVA